MFNHCQSVVFRVCREKRCAAVVRGGGEEGQRGSKRITRRTLSTPRHTRRHEGVASPVRKIRNGDGGCQKRSRSDGHCEARGGGAVREDREPTTTPALNGVERRFFGSNQCRSYGERSKINKSSSLLRAAGRHEREHGMALALCHAVGRVTADRRARPSRTAAQRQ